PLANIVSKHHFTMRSRHDDSVLSSFFGVNRNSILIFFDIKSGGSFMHRWPQSIQSEPKQQFKHMAVEENIWCAKFCGKLFFNPIDCPLFIIDKNTTIPNRRRLLENR